MKVFMLLQIVLGQVPTLSWGLHFSPVLNQTLGEKIMVMVISSQDKIKVASLSRVAWALSAIPHRPIPWDL